MFLLKIQRDLCHPKSFGTFEKRVPGLVDSHVHGTNLCLVDDLIQIPESGPRDCGFYMVDR